MADNLRVTLDVNKFETAIVANGTNFADALAGSYLAAKKSAPILMTDKNAKNITNLVNYIKANVKPGGTVYILAGYTVERLAGADRYETNLMILDAAEVTSEAILVATGLPMLLAENNAVKIIDAYTEEVGIASGYVLGGSGLVSDSSVKTIFDASVIK